MNSEISELKSNLTQLEKFRHELEPQLETARREIELNKSMLDMLNNEISHLNTEKIQLEKKLISARRNTTPSVIVEEEEEDLIEEEQNGLRSSSSKQEDKEGVIDVASDSHDNHNPESGTDGSLHFLNKVKNQLFVNL